MCNNKKMVCFSYFYLMKLYFGLDINSIFAIKFELYKNSKLWDYSKAQ